MGICRIVIVGGFVRRVSAHNIVSGGLLAVNRLVKSPDSTEYVFLIKADAASHQAHSEPHCEPSHHAAANGVAQRMLLMPVVECIER